MRYVVALLLLAGPALGDDVCPAKAGDPCRAEQDRVCNVDRNPPPWATPESQAKKREKLERELAGCRERHKDDPPAGEKKPSLPPWRKP
jgi:hypothetical protein